MLSRVHFVATVTFVIAVAIIGATGMAQHDDPKEEMKKDAIDALIYYKGLLKDHKWPDENGKPKGVPAEHWKGLSYDLGIIWIAKADAPDRAIFALRVDGQWRALDVFNTAALELSRK